MAAFWLAGLVFQRNNTAIFKDGGNNFLWNYGKTYQTERYHNVTILQKWKVGFPVKWWQSPVALHDTKTQKTTVRIKIKWWIFRFHRRMFSKFFSHNSLPGTCLWLEGSIICSHYTRNEYLGSRDKGGTRLQDEQSEVRILACSKDYFLCETFRPALGHTLTGLISWR